MTVVGKLLFNDLEGRLGRVQCDVERPGHGFFPDVSEVPGVRVAGRAPPGHVGPLILHPRAGAQAGSVAGFEDVSGGRVQPGMIEP